MSSRFKPSCLKKLLSTDNDWNLARAPSAGRTSRTRGAGNGRPNFELLRKKKLISCNDNVVDLSGPVAGEATGVVGTEAAGGPPKKKVKPSHTRVLLEVKQLEDAFAQYVCPNCQEQPLEVKMKTVCIATSLALTCNLQQQEL
jgi:hypothetical protein